MTAPVLQAPPWVATDPVSATGSRSTGGLRQPSTSASRVVGFARAGVQDRCAPRAALAPGAATHVAVRVGVVPPYCLAVTPGATSTAVEVPVVVRTLGLPATERVGLPVPVSVTGASAACS